MTKCWLVPFLIAGLVGDKAFAECLPAPDTPAAVIEHFQRFNKPLPEQYCAKKAAPRAPQESPKQAEEAPDQYRNDNGSGDGPFAQYEGDPDSGFDGDTEGAYESDPGGGYEDDQEGAHESDPGGGYESDQGGGYEDDPGGGYESDQGGSYQGDQEGGYQGGGYQGDLEGGYVVPRSWSLDYWKNDDKGHKSGKHRKSDGKKGKGHGKRKSACKKAHMKWNESTKTCSKRR